MLPTYGINAAIFLRTHEEYQQDKIRILELSGWLKKSADNFISLHPLIREVCKLEVAHAQSECRAFVEKYSREISDLPMPERISRRREQMEIVSNAADMLSDSDGQLSKMAGDLNYLEGRARHAWHYYQKYWKIFLKLNNSKPNTLEAATIMGKIAWSASNASEFAKAIYFVESTLAVAERELGSDRAKLLPHYINFASIYRRARNFDKATKLYATAIKLAEEHEVDDFIRVKLFISCAKFFSVRGAYESALSYARRAMRILARRCDFSPTISANALEIFVEYSLRKNLTPFALENSRKVAEIYENFYGKENPVTAESYINVARALTADKNFDEALTWLERAQKILEETCGQVHPATGKVYSCMAMTLYEKGEFTTAYDWLAKVSVICAQIYGQRHPYTIEVLSKMFDWQKKIS